MALFESPIDHPPSKLRRYVIRIAAVLVTIAVFVAVFPAYLWYPFVYHREVATAHRFMNAVSCGQPARGLSDLAAVAVVLVQGLHRGLGARRLLRASEELQDRAAGARQGGLGDGY